MVQFRNYEWHPAPLGTTKRCHDISAPQSPLTIRSRTLSRNAVPSGVVASRVLLLQRSSQGKSDVSSTRSPSLAIKHHRGSSRNGFDWRLTNRFEQPTVLSCKPDEDALEVDTTHTFTSLSTPRKNQNAHHAIADSQLRLTQSSTQIRLLAQAHDGLTSTGGPMKKSKSYNPVRQPHNSLDIDVLREIDSSGNQTNFITQTSIFPLPANADEPDMWRGETKARTKNTLNSENSFVTTSTIRRQSVRELFNYYGIDRPAGLISKYASQEIKSATEVDTLGRCHLCSWNNSDPYSPCWRCGHSICSQCDKKPKRSNLVSRGMLPTRLLEAQKPDIPPREIRFVEEDPTKHILPAVVPTDLNVKSSTSTRKLSAIPASISHTCEVMRSRSSRKTPPLLRSSQEQTRGLSVLSGSQTTTKVKESPFLIADGQVPRRPLRQIPLDQADPRLNTRLSHRIPHRQSKECQNDCPFPDDGNDDMKEGNLIYRSTPLLGFHTNHMKSSPPYHAHEDTDRGYVADVSAMDEGMEIERLAALTDSEPRRNSAKAEKSLSSNAIFVENVSEGHSSFELRSQYFSAMPESGSFPLSCSNPHSSQSRKHQSTLQGSEIPEFVECHGYPRTGHARHGGSPIDSSAVGECQHCLDDCPCAACQNTDHSVRCCTHADHQAIAHIHHTLQRKASTQLLTTATTSNLMTLDVDPQSLPISPRTSVTVPPVLQQAQSVPSPVKKSASKVLPRSRSSMRRKRLSVLSAHRTQNSVASEADIEPGSFVDAVMNLDKNKSVVAMISEPSKRQSSIIKLLPRSFPDTSPLLFKQGDIFSEALRKNVPDSTVKTNDTRIPFPLDANSNIQKKQGSFTFPSGKTSKVTGVFPRERLIQMSPSSSGSSPNQLKLLPQKNPDRGSRLSHKLLENQQVLENLVKEGSIHEEFVVQKANIRQVQGLESSIDVPLRSSSLTRSGGTSQPLEKEMKLTFEWKPTPVDGNHEVKSLLFTDEDRVTTLCDYGRDNTPPIGGSAGVSTSHTSATADHDYVRRTKHLNTLAGRDGQSERNTTEGEVPEIDISGITIVLHLEGRKDLVIKAESWKRGHLTVDSARG